MTPPNWSDFNSIQNLMKCICYFSSDTSWPSFWIILISYASSDIKLHSISNYSCLALSEREGSFSNQSLVSACTYLGLGTESYESRRELTVFLGGKFRPNQANGLGLEWPFFGWDAEIKCWIGICLVDRKRVGREAGSLGQGTQEWVSWTSLAWRLSGSRDEMI